MNWLRVCECQRKGSAWPKLRSCFIYPANSPHIISPTEIKVGFSFTEPGFLAGMGKTQSSDQHSGIQLFITSKQWLQSLPYSHRAAAARRSRKLGFGRAEVIVEKYMSALVKTVLDLIYFWPLGNGPLPASSPLTSWNKQLGCCVCRLRFVDAAAIRDSPDQTHSHRILCSNCAAGGSLLPCWVCGTIDPTKRPREGSQAQKEAVCRGRTQITLMGSCSPAGLHSEFMGKFCNGLMSVCGNPLLLLGVFLFPTVLFSFLFSMAAMNRWAFPACSQLTCEHQALAGSRFPLPGCHKRFNNHEENNLIWTHCESHALCYTPTTAVIAGGSLAPLYVSQQAMYAQEILTAVQQSTVLLSVHGSTVTNSWEYTQNSGVLSKDMGLLKESAAQTICSPVYFHCRKPCWKCCIASSTQYI